MTPQSEQIKLNIESLDIKSIHKVLTILNIKWNFPKTGEQRVPTEEDIASIAEFCMREAFKSPDKYHQIGGFEAEVNEGIIEIRFVLSKANPLSKLLG